VRPADEVVAARIHRVQCSYCEREVEERLVLEVILRHLQLVVELVEDLGHIRGLQVDPSAHRCMLIVLDSVVLAA